MIAALTGSEVADFYGPFKSALGLRHSAVDAFQLFAVGFARWAPVFAMAPFLGGRLAPPSVRTGLAVMMALWMMPSLSARAPVPLGLEEATFWAVLLKEILVGFLLAFASSLVFWAAEMGGKFIDNVRGTTTANLLIPQVTTQSSLLGDFYFQLFVVLYVVAGGHRWFLAAVFESYEVVPPLVPRLGTAGMAQQFTEATARLLVVAVQIMAPALIVLMMLDLVLGVANRMAPQLDVYFLSLSLKSSIGALVVALSLYYLLAMAPQMFRQQEVWTRQMVGDMRPSGLPAPTLPPPMPSSVAPPEPDPSIVPPQPPATAEPVLVPTSAP